MTLIMPEGWEDLVVNVGDPRPAGVSPHVWNWAMEYAKHKVLCKEVFQDRADKVIEASKELATVSTAGALQSLDLCMQIEEEFPGRVEEFVGRSQLHPQGALIGLQQYIAYQRNRG